MTANLDLAGLMEDYLSQMSADECEVAFEVLHSLTVCDPTCGSGAFLLSALDVLEPMYTTVLDRAREIAASINAGPALGNQIRPSGSLKTDPDCSLDNPRFPVLLTNIRQHSERGTVVKQSGWGK